MQLKALGIDENIGHCTLRAKVYFSLLARLSDCSDYFGSRFVVLFRHFHFLNVVQSNCNSENSLFSLE